MTYFGDPLCKKYIFFIARGVQLDNGVDHPCEVSGLEYGYSILLE